MIHTCNSCNTCSLEACQRWKATWRFEGVAGAAALDTRRQEGSTMAPILPLLLPLLCSLGVLSTAEDPTICVPAVVLPPLDDEEEDETSARESRLTDADALPTEDPCEDATTVLAQEPGERDSWPA